MIGRWGLGAFACLLLLVGGLGFADKEGAGPTSSAPAYNVFRWKPLDDRIHVALGAALVLVGAIL